MGVIISLNGISPPCEPVGFTITKNDLYSDKSGRSAETGVSLLYPIRYDTYVIDLEYVLTSEQAKRLESLIAGSDITVRFYDGNIIQTAHMYPSSERSKEFLGTWENPMWRMTFSLVEL